ncbi:Zn-ribbon domain-containing OB-fold protein [Nocardioides humi]|uniref:OB-fold domain-containing protein n=1 Tax=Nocardioides humi TaxID=449461 RepID=A0ABN2B407_9ACTN|nr:OB-fold domain-containing protein [Nocardioides humi]
MATRSIARDFFVEDLDRGWSLVGTRCRSCHEQLFGRADPACPRCAGPDLDPVLLPASGAVWAYTVQRNPPPGRRRATTPTVPYAVGLVELDGIGLRILTHIDVDPERVTVGLPVRLAVRELYHEHDELVVGFAFEEVLS